MGGSWTRRCALLAALLACAAAATATATAAAATASDAAGSRSHNNSWHKPGFCGRMDCPEFTIWQKSPEFQLREYKPAYWVATNVSEVEYETAVKRAGKVLFRYFWGANEEGLRMKETVPLTAHVKLDVHPHTGERRNYTFFMYIPYEHQTDSDPVLRWQLQEEPPKPNNTAVWLLRNPQAHMFVRMFKHRPHEWRIQEQSRRLAEALTHAGHDFEAGAVLVASYDHPMKHHPRRHHYHHSEIWMRGTANLTAMPPPAS